jgi:hypothetical protein
MTNEEIIDAVERLQGALSRAEDTMRQPAKYVAEAQARADKAIEALRERTWVELTMDDFTDILKLASEGRPLEVWELFKAVETKAREKNNG